LGVLPSILGAFWEAVLELVRRLGLALDAAAPTLGTYAAAEIGILAALFFVLQVSRRRRAHQQVTLI
jgi:hypothetical protein